MVSWDACHIGLKDGGSCQDGEMEFLPFRCERGEGGQFRGEVRDHATAIECEAKIFLWVRGGWEGKGQVCVGGDRAALGDIEEAASGRAISGEQGLHKVRVITNGRVI